MKTYIRGPLSAILLFSLATFCFAGDPVTQEDNSLPSGSISVVVNFDTVFPVPNSVEFYLASGTQLTYQSNLPTSGFGIAGGFFGTSRLASIPSISAPCVYASDAGSNDIASVSLSTQQLVGNFAGSLTDDGSSNGIGLAVNAHYLYASFTSSNTIGAFALQGGCGLTFLGDVPAIGLQGGSVSGMAVNGTMLVVAYGDGSIQSFTVTGGMPVSNNDLRNSAGFTTGSARFFAGPSMPSSVDITQDGRFAIFGDISATTTVEVSNLTTGKLATTVPYTVGASTQGAAVDAGAIRLSPDQTLLYAANSESGTVTAAFFNASTGAVTTWCTSPTLRGFNGRPWLGSVVTRDTTGTGTILYVGEFGRQSGEVNQGLSSQIGILTVATHGASCTLTEASNSPLPLVFPGALSIGVYPPRPF